MQHNCENPMAQISLEDFTSFFEHIGPVAVGTFVSMYFTEGKWKKKISQGAANASFGFYMSDSVYALLQSWDKTKWVTATGACVLTVLFGVALVSYVFELWKQLLLGPMLREWVAKRLGVTNPEDKNAGN